VSDSGIIRQPGGELSWRGYEKQWAMKDCDPWGCAANEGPQLPMRVCDAPPSGNDLQTRARRVMSDGEMGMMSMKNEE
jgi:hypothetical protein